jgi:hypothetical protein
MSVNDRRVSAAAVAATLLDISAPIFAAAWMRGQGGDTLIVHLAAAPKRAVLCATIASALRNVGVERVRIRFHNAAQLQSPRSLDRLVARFAGDEIVYDPTGAVARARALVAAGRAVRETLADKLFGLYYAPRLRTFYVALKAASLAHGEKVKIGALAEIERSVGAAMTAAFAPSLADCPAVRIGFGLPVANLVAVDARSVVHWSARVTRTLRRIWKPLTLAALFGMGLTAGASAREPAVSETNLKLNAQAGDIDDESIWTASGALTAPLGQFTGVQLEAGVGAIDGELAYGGAAHFFTRDPDKYLLGLFAAYGEAADFDLNASLIGAEAEIYLNQVSILAQAGYQFVDGFGGSTETPFGSIDLRWYATDNFWLSAGGSFQEDASQAQLKAEFMPGFSALPGLAFNAQGVIGDDDYTSVMGGLTYYFGSDASLKDRHRKQDPDSALFGLFRAVEQERKRLEAIYGTTQ